ncbi:hypothetical protein RP20_CCG007925 [Aedes albopictus]|nr:hypothetical protein RP20_CCG007925 [Aedes albopictus]
MPPGDIADRLMVCGQLDWVMTLVLDAIGRDSLPQPLYMQLFRGDILTGTIFRRFLLAQRILRKAGVNPQSRPALPDCSTHRLWALWDKIMDLTVTLVERQGERTNAVIETFFRSILDGQYKYPDLLLSALTLSPNCPNAYDLLKADWGKFNDHAFLEESIVMHAVRILQSDRRPLRQPTTNFLVELVVGTPTVQQWLKPTIQLNLLNHLEADTEPRYITQTLYLQSLLERKSTDADSAPPQTLTTRCVELLNHQDPEVRLWSALLAKKLSAEKCPTLQTRLEELSTDADPKVRAAAVEAWNTSYGQQTETEQKDILISKLLPVANANSSAFVRRELAYALNVIAADRTPELISLCKQETSKPPESSKSKGKAKAKKGSTSASTSKSSDSVLAKAWRLMVALQTDPDAEVATGMQSVVAFVRGCVAQQEAAAAGGKRKKKAPVAGSCPLAERVPLQRRLCHTLVEIDEAVGGEESKENDPQELNIVSLPVGPRNPALPLLNHQLRSLKVKEAPEMVRFGISRQMFTVFKDHVTWQDLTEDTGKPHILKHPLVPGSLFKVTALLPGIPLLPPSLLIGYNDGSIRLWQIPTSQTEPTLVTTWQGLHGCGDISPSAKTHGISMTSIGDRKLIIGGDAKYLRQWDLVTELALGDVPVGTDQAVTALASNGVYNIAAGLEGGTVRLFDTRAEAEGKVAVGPKHSNPVRAISLRADNLNMISVCRGGSAHLVDLRKMIPAVKKWSWSGVPADVAIHPILDLMAFGAAQSLEVYSTGGEQQCGSEEGAVCVDFHPTEAVLAAGNARNKVVQLYGEWAE